MSPALYFKEGRQAQCLALCFSSSNGAPRSRAVLAGQVPPQVSKSAPWAGKWAQGCQVLPKRPQVSQVFRAPVHLKYRATHSPCAWSLHTVLKAALSGLVLTARACQALAGIPKQVTRYDPSWSWLHVCKS